MGKLLQLQRITSGKFSTGAVIPADDTIPQITEGLEVMAIAFTPLSDTSTLYFSVETTVDRTSTIALFVDATADALASRAYFPTVVAAHSHFFDHETASASTTERTYRVRMGPDGSGTLKNHGGTPDDGGGIYALTSFEIMEVEA